MPSRPRRSARRWRPSDGRPVREGPTAAGHPTGATAAVSSAGLTKRYGAQTVVDAIGLEVPPGAVYGFLGPNGSGKTTTIRMLLGLVRPTHGQIELLGASMPAGAEAVLPRVGSLVEGPAFHPYLSGRANLARLDAADRCADPRSAPATDRRRTRPGGAPRSGLEALPRVLPGHAPTAGHRRRAAGAPRPAHPRRADQRPGPPGHPRGPPPRGVLGWRRRDRTGVKPPAFGGRADVLARRGDACRPTGGAGHRCRGPGQWCAGHRRGDHRPARSSRPRRCETSG